MRTRYTQDLSPGDVFLGQYRELDLWYCGQGPLPATIVARYGNEPGDYQTMNPRLMTLPSIEQACLAEPAFRHALAILNEIGYAADVMPPTER